MRKQLQLLTRAEVFVGIPSSNNSRGDGKVGNAELLFIHTNGSALNHIPARPVLEPAITQPKTQELIAKQLSAVVTDILAIKPEAAEQDLEKAGLIAENAAKRWFTDPSNGWAPNAPATIARKGSSKPLIDTGEMRRSITHVVVMPK